MTFPALPARAAYLTINNAAKRNALSLPVLRNLRDQLHDFNRAPSGEVKLLPPFKPDIIEQLQDAARNGRKNEYSWLVNAEEFATARKDKPSVIVLRTEGNVFCSGHDLKEIRTLPYDQIKETFALCAEVMSLIRRSPAPVIAVVQGLATAAGAQLAFTADITIAEHHTQFNLPGQSLGLPCTSPSTAVGRRLGAPFTYRMLTLAEPVAAHQLPAGSVEIVSAGDDFEKKIEQIVGRIAEKTAPQAQAFGKWAFWTQMSIDGSSKSGGDGYEDAVKWAGDIMALHALLPEAKEGMAAFFEKRSPEWKL